MDFLVEANDAIQEAVFFGVANLLNLEVDIILPHGELWQTTTPTAMQAEAFTKCHLKPPPRHYSIAASGKG